MTDRQTVCCKREGAGRAEPSPAEAEGQAENGKGRKNTARPFLPLVNLLRALASPAVRKQVLSALRGSQTFSRFPWATFPLPGDSAELPAGGRLPRRLSRLLRT